MPNELIELARGFECKNSFDHAGQRGPYIWFIVFYRRTKHYPLPNNWEITQWQ